MTNVPESKDFPPCFYRLSIKAICKKDGKIMFIKKPSGAHGLPGGGLDFGENVQEGVAREMMEEIGLTVTKVATNPTYAWIHKFEQYRDMEWFYSYVVAYEVEIDFDIPMADAKYDEIVFLSEEEIRTAKLDWLATGLVDVIGKK